MAKPIRVQRKRVKGWRMPPNTVYVGRPSKWGNPYGIEYGRANAVNLFKNAWLIADYSDIQKLQNELKGKNLACWCALNQPCHADILLKLANKK